MQTPPETLVVPCPPMAIFGDIPISSPLSPFLLYQARGAFQSLIEAMYARPPPLDPPPFTLSNPIPSLSIHLQPFPLYQAREAFPSLNDAMYARLPTGKQPSLSVHHPSLFMHHSSLPNLNPSLSIHLPPLPLYQAREAFQSLIDALYARLPAGEQPNQAAPGSTQPPTSRL